MIQPVASFVSDLLAWYNRYAAILPWRGSHDPYHVWLSEVMLQQTQIATVAPYYARFLIQFPTVTDLAAAPIDVILKAWEGLGYYSRARNLHRAAQQVISDFGGQFPTSAAELQTLPGIGRYTAGAIASIVYGEQVAALDGNAIRVLTRLFNIAEDVTRPATLDALWELDESLVPADRPGMYNQALMDLGRTICTTRHPACAICPVANHCQAKQVNTQEQRPVKAKRAPIPHVDIASGLIRRADGMILIAQRHPERLLGGLWGLPGGNVAPDELFPEALRRILGADPESLTIGGLLGEVSHAFTHFRITLHVFGCYWTSPAELPTIPPDYSMLRWVPIDDLETFAFARADRRALELARKTGWLNADPTLKPPIIQSGLWDSGI